MKHPRFEGALAAEGVFAQFDQELRVAIRRHISRYNLADTSRIERWFEPIADQMVYELSMNLRGRAVDEKVHDNVYVPATWWQHVKQRWFPNWALRRWPVVQRAIPVAITKQIHFCPHDALRQTDLHTVFVTEDLIRKHRREGLR